MNSVSQLRLLDIASSEVLTVTPDTSLEAVVTRFVETRVSSLVVVEHGKPVGIVTERDLLRLMCLGMAEDKPVREVMSSPLLTARFDLDFSSAQLLMANRGIRHLVLVNDDGVMLGLATETDFRRHLGSDFFDLIQSLRAVMDHGAELIDPALSLAEALRLMSAGRLDYLVGGVDGWAEGILTERDVPRLLARHVNPQALTFGEVMSRPLITISLDIPVSDAARQMDIKRLRHLGVVDSDGRLVGVVSQHRMLERLGVVLLDESRSHLEDRMGLVLEATGVGTWEYDHQLDILIRSSALNRMLKLIPGKSRETLDSVLQRIEPADRAKMAACFYDLLSGETAEFAQDYQVRGGDGHLRWMSSRGARCRMGQSGQTAAFSGSGN
jgi:CBS domain-containing protein